jgi:glycosyltransferase involved in cell wall biosynthesis
MKKLDALLTIAIPTYNRAHVLSECLSHLLEVAYIHRDDIEIVISDNASSDNSDDVVKKIGAKISNYSNFIYFKNSNNVGVSKNIISLFKKTNGKYFLLLGDDDYISKENISYILKVLSDEHSPSAIIQSRWNGSPRTSKAGFVSCEFASELFYEYGNTYAGIVDRQAALKVLDNNDILMEIEKIVWPQTVIGFLAIQKLKDRPIYIADFEIGGSIQGCQNVTNKAYWVTSLYGLLRASFLIDRQIGKNWTKKRFVYYGSKGFLGHIKAIIYFGLIAENSNSSLVQKELQAHFGWSGYFWSIILLLSERFPGLYLWIGVVTYSFIRMKSPRFVFRKFVEAKTQYAEKLIASKSSKKRYGDWF